MGIFDSDISGTGIFDNSIGPGSTFFNFIKNEASNALGIDQATGRTPTPNKSYTLSGYDANAVLGTLETKERSFIGQEPDARVFIKKRSFGGFREHFNSPFLSGRERFYTRVLKRLFASKTEQVAQAELLTKFIKRVDQNKTPLKRIAFNIMSDLFNTNSDRDIFNGLMFLAKEDDRIDNDNISRWIIDHDDPDTQNLGLGTGVIELTNVNQISTSLNLENPGDLGSCSLSIEDPFAIMRITAEDIDRAIDDERSELQASLNMSAKAAASILDRATEGASRLNTITNNLNEQPGNSQFGNIEFNFKNETAASKLIGKNLHDTSLDSDSIFANPGDIQIKRTINNGQDTTVLSPDQDTEANSLRPEEERQFKSVVSDMREFQSIANSARDNILSQRDFEQVRQDLLSSLANKTLINAMDHVYIYMSSNTSKDSDQNMIMEDNTTPDSVLRNEFTKFIKDNTLSNVITEDLFVEIKKQQLLKNRRKGSFVFVGLVDSARRSYADGRHSVTISSSNNIKWLGFSKINVQPSARQPRGALDFPLTPFEEKEDENGNTVLDLLTVNQNKLGEREKSILLAEAQKNSGVIKNIDNFEGLVFKWKRGLFSATARVQFRPSVDNDGSRVSANEAQLRIGLLVNQNAFANLDAANIISTLVTGVPYNFTNFLRNSIRSGIYTQGPNHNKSYAANTAAVTSLLNDANGQFEPLITINVLPDEQSLPNNSSNFNTEFDTEIGTISRQINAKTKSKNESVSYLNAYENITGSNVNENKRILRGSNILLQNQINELQDRLEILKAFRELRLTERKLAYRDPIQIAQENKLFGLDSSPENDPFDSQIRRLQGLLHNMTFKTINDVILNKDKNYLIISNEYEEDFDIQAFVQRLRSEGPDLWRSTYESPLEVCRHVATTIDFELFADTQGNIVFRPPQYNKTPLSILNQLKVENSKREIFPESITKLLQDRVSGLRNSATRSQNTLDKNKKDDNLSKDDVARSEARINELNQLADSIERQKSKIQGLNIDSLLSANNEFFDRFVEVDQLLEPDGDKLSNKDTTVSAINQRFDDIGEGSHARFIVGDDVVISYDISESAPPFTRVDVTGQTNLVELADVEQTALWAGAVDYDLWRQYGYIQQEFTKPFFRSPEFQCKPYAEFLLSRARKQIFKGTVTLVGNEYYQLGDVIFLEAYQMLFYVTRIDHSFTFGNQFTTTLTLNYARVPGEFIPTPLDIIGKNIIKAGILLNAVSSNISPTNKIKANPDGVELDDKRERVLGVVNLMSDSSGSLKLTPTVQNYKELLNALSLAKGMIAQASISPLSQQPVINKIKIRYFSGDDAPAKIVEDWLIRPNNILQENAKINIGGLGSSIFRDLLETALIIEEFDSKEHRFSRELSSFFSDQVPDSNISQLNNFVEIRVSAEPTNTDEINQLNSKLLQRLDGE